MDPTIHAADVSIRTRLLPGDLGYVAYLHGRLYAQEYEYGPGFEGYVLEGLGEFAHHYDPSKDRVWICEHRQKIVGFLLGMRRGDALQLRYFILLPEYRGLGMGKRMMDLFVGFMKEAGYRKAFLWTTDELHAAATLYTRHGFRLTEEKASTSFGKQLTERRYDLDLTA
jgi:GNAT superfamily N-acetyltransferase